MNNVTQGRDSHFLMQFMGNSDSEGGIRARMGKSFFKDT